MTTETLTAKVAIIDVDAAEKASAYVGVRLEVLEAPNSTAPSTTLVEVTGPKGTVQTLLFEWGFTPDEFPEYFKGWKATTGLVVLMLTCPHCGASMTPLRELTTSRRAMCESCAEWFDVEVDALRDAQHALLVALGEA